MTTTESTSTSKIRRLSPRQLELLQLRLRRKQAAEGRGVDGPVALSAEAWRSGLFPLSFSQRRLWFLHQLDAHSSAYHLAFALELRGPLDGAALRRAWHLLVARHSALRTIFVPPAAGSEEVEAQQQILAPAPLALPQVDLVTLSPAGTEIEVGRWLHEQGTRPFDLAQGPLLRALLLRLAAREHVLVLTCHHIVADGLSVVILERELLTLYLELRRGKAPLLPPLPLQFVEFATWQRQHLVGEVLAQQLEFWRGQLAGAPPLLELPADRPRPAVPAGRGGGQEVVFEAALTAALGGLSRTFQGTLFMVLSTGLAALLSRLSGSSDVVLGTPVSGRTHSPLEGLVGLFINNLVLRLRLAGDPHLPALLTQVREVVEQASAHQELPFDRLVEELQPERSLSHTPLFQVLLALQPSTEVTAVADLALRHRPTETGAAKYDLSLILSEFRQPSGVDIVLKGVLRYSRDLFDDSTILRWRRQLFTLLGAMVDHQGRISELPLLEAAERVQLLVEWSTRPVPRPRGLLFHQRVWQRAALSPDAAAVCCGEQVLTFGELRRRARHLAAGLVARGVGAEVVVGVALDSSPEMVVALLGVLEAGGAYLPLDPTDPRRPALLAASGAALVLVTDGVEEPPLGVEALTVRSAAWRADAALPTAKVPDALHLAYVLYTSGSTGHPKGVLVSHHSLINYLHWAEDELLAEQTVPVISRMLFDACHKQLFLPLLRGLPAVLLSPPTVADPAALLAAVEASRQRVLNCVPSLWEGVVGAMETAQARLPRQLERLIFGGEELSQDLVHRTRALLPGLRIDNTYGPTETTSNASWTELGRHGVPLGRPAAGARLQVLDRSLRPCPIGVVGELLIGGAGVARGYLEQPALTAERFIPDAYGGGAGDRLYRSGDRVRFLADGSLGFAGRLDDQIKIRGLRVEPGEVEVALRRHPAVAEVAVVASGEGGDRHLVAWWTALQDPPPSAVELRHFLAGCLPPSLLPAAFPRLASLPRTATGKLDRGGLARRPVEREVSTAGSMGEAPRTATQAHLVEAFEQVLHTTVGIDDDFFALGGHSLAALRVISRLRRQHGLELPLRTFFEGGSVRALAAALEGMKGCQDGRPPAITPRLEEVERAPLSFAQQRLWFVDQLEPGNPAYNVPQALRLAGDLDLVVLRRSLTEVVRRHAVLRTVFLLPAGGDGQPQQHIQPPSPVPLPRIDLGALNEPAREEEWKRLAEAEARRPFDLARGPLLRVRVVVLGPLDHGVLLTQHHIVCDAWSTGILVEELMAIYRAFAAGLPSPLPALAVQYAEVALWQRSWLRGERLQVQLDWWCEQLAGAPPSLALPTDRPRPALPTYRGRALKFQLEAEFSEALEEFARSQGSTLFMVLLAAFALLLRRHSGQREVVVGSTTAGRRLAEFETMIGFFINTLALRVEVAGGTFEDLLGRVRHTTLGAWAHQDLPFEKLVDRLHPQREGSSSPVFQVVLQLLNTPRTEFAMEGLSWRAVALETTTAKFDQVLNLTAIEGGLAGLWIYNSDLYDGTTMARRLGHFIAALRSLVRHPGQDLEEVSLLTPGERHQLVVEWAGGGREQQAFEPLHGAFERWARHAPAALALRCGGAGMSYGELDRQAEFWARRLCALGVGPEVRVALCLGRSPLLPIAILAVLKAGGAYVPLDPDYPAERLQFLLQDAQVTLLLTEAASSPPSPPPGVRCLGLDLETAGKNSRLDDEEEAPWRPPVEAENAAYVIYTSGSTGRPKGVVVSHGQVQRLFAASAPWLQFGPADVWTLFHSYAFDFSVWELWGALAHGGRLVMVPYAVSRSPMEFYGLLVAERVTVLNQTPSAFYPLLRAEEGLGELERLALRWVIFGGEGLDLSRLAPWFARHGERRPRLVNMYGITETTVHVTCRTLAQDDLAAGPASPLGPPLADLSLHLLSAEGRPVPLGAAGEICVGGAGVARGYLHRPALTAERFVPDPWSGRRGARLYRSGDRARFRSQGEAESLGRIDLQVKVRGFRIELGEIESALGLHPQVADCVVVLQPAEAAAPPQLVAYVVAQDGESGEPRPTAGELRQDLAQRLPAHMLPAAFLWLDALPLTVHGKVDRRALPAAGSERPRSARPLVAPRDALEGLLSGLWQEVLGLEQVGVEDDFFELGGDSIRGAILINRVQQLLDEIIHVVVIFDAPSVAELALYLRHHYPLAVARRCPGLEDARRSKEGPEAEQERRAAAGQGLVGWQEIGLFRGLIEPLPPPRQTAEQKSKNPSALFILSPPRSGTTLLRVLLGGHSRLFAPPELELLSFNTLAERAEAFSGRDRFWLEGAQRAVMELWGEDAASAELRLQQAAAEGMSCRGFYGAMQQRLGERTLVDKTPSYSLDPAILERAEEDFDRPLYIHLLRHPQGMISSFEEARLEQIFFRRRHPFSRRQLAELIWLVSHQNIQRFLQSVPAERQHRLLFEDLVRDPETELRALCASLQLPFEGRMLAAYEDADGRMTDGIRAESKMLGDIKFHQHRRIDPAVAERFKGDPQARPQGPVSLDLMRSMGYGEEAAPGGAEDIALLPVARRGEQVSFAQERLWFLDQLDSGNPVYNIPLPLSLRGALRLGPLRGALAAVVERHEVLRSTFAMAGGEPRLQVAALPPPLAPLVDLSALGVARRRAEGQKWARLDAQRPFDLEHGPVLRATLLRFSAGEHGLLLNLHHIAADGWSLGILVRELVTFYRSLVEGEAPGLAPLPIQYADFAAWQRRWLHSPSMEGELSWWRQHLGAEVAPLPLPLDFPRPAVQSFRGATRSAPLLAAGDTLSALQQLSREVGCTRFMVLLAAFQALLHHLTGVERIAVGSPIAGRGRPQVEGLIGFFVNTLVLTADTVGDPSFSQFLDRVRRSTLGAFGHQDLPFEKLVEALQPERRLSHQPLVQVMFTLQNAPREGLALSGLEVLPWEVPVAVAKFDLTLAVAEFGGGLHSSLNYNTSLFRVETIDRLLAHFRHLLTSALATPGLPLSQLNLHSAATRHQLLEWNDTASAYPREAGLAELFSAQARRTPTAPALCFADGELTYGELEGRANALAHGLRGHGVGAEVCVGLAVERSAAWVVAILAIVKAGGAYIPLDATYPAERLAFMVRDSGCRLLLSDGSLPTLEVEGVPQLMVSGIEEGGSPAAVPGPPEAVAGPPVVLGGRHLAYVIYTSGSTGRPKGVAVGQRAVSRLVLATHYVALAPGHRLAQLSNAAFDAATFEIWGALLNGGCLVGIAKEVMLSPAALEQALRRQAVDTLFITTALFSQLVLASPTVFSSLRQVLFGGEVVDPAVVRKALQDAPSTRLLHVYGPTESTTFALCHGVESVAAEAGTVPIGRPINNTTAQVVGRRGAVVVAGVAGELLLGGEGLARGYFNRPALTARQFVPDAMSPVPGGRLYRTGDLVRRTGDGLIDFQGRFDQQVKLRGFRIELGEVEAALRARPEVRECLAVVREDAPGDHRLVAYVVAAERASTEGDAALPAALRRGLAESLPGYMVPAVVMLLTAFPLTPNGKVDRRALPAPEALPEGSMASRLAPSTPTEELLLEIWSDLLALPGLGMDAHFFDLGGHSLLATRLVSRIRDVLRVEVALRQVFDTPTPAGLAAALGSARHQGSAPLEPLPRPSAEQGMPLSFAQRRLWFLDRLVPDTPFYNIFQVVRLDGRLDFLALERAFHALLARHEGLRTSFHEGAEGPRQVAAAEVSLPVPRIDLGQLPHRRRQRAFEGLVAAAAGRLHHLAQGPLLRVEVVHLGEDENVLLLNLHHIVSDGWSMGILYRELAAFYEGFLVGREPSLPALPWQPADFALWQEDWLSGERLAALLAFWRQQLATAPRVLELPLDRPRPRIESFRGSTEPLRLSAARSAALRGFGRHQGTTASMTLLAGFSALLHRLTGQAGIPVGVAVANRNRSEIEGLIGFFVNTLVIHTSFVGQPSFAELAGRVREGSLLAYEHQDLPFDRLVEELELHRDLSRNPLCQVMFGYQNFPNRPLTVQGLTLEPVGQDRPDMGSAKFDLSLFLVESEENFSGAIEYNSDLFDRSTVRRLAGQLDCLLAAVSAEPERPLGEILLLSPGQRQQLLEWNDTTTVYPQEAGLAELFAAQVQRTPDALALCFTDGELSYRALDRRANALAHVLRGRGVGPEVCVGVAVDRSAAWVVAILAVLKAGGAYVPLDASYPQERLAFMVLDSGCRLLLSDGSLPLLGVEGVPLLRVPALDDADSGQAVVGQAMTGPLPRSRGQHLAYIIYTSGSSGQPKGVAVAQRAVSRLVLGTDYAILGPGVRVGQLSNAAFDAATFEIWGALLHGGCVVGIAKDVMLSPAQLQEALERQQVDTLFITAALFAQLVLTSDTVFSSLREVLFGGEAADPAAVRKLLRDAPATRLINAYGPTESTTFALCHRLLGLAEEAVTVAIGRPIKNTTAQIVEVGGAPAVVGVAGELRLGGDGLARGYFNRPALTAERFVPDDRSTLAGGRLYRTGDLARRRADGLIEFLGRFDDQVKLRGFRIELGEIEALLGAQPEVRECTVMLRQDLPGDGRLVAYVVLEEGAGGAVESEVEGEGSLTEDLRRRLASKLPEYMLPAAMVELPALPLTANGKLDRRALPAPEFSRGDGEKPFVGPRTPFEAQLAAIWCEVLGLEAVSVDDDFFSLGGHSLLATQVVSRLRRDLGVELPLRTFFAAPTVAELAGAVAAERRAAQAASGLQPWPPLRPMHRGEIVPLSFAQERLWFLERLAPHTGAYNVPSLIELVGEVVEEGLAAALDTIRRRHESLRTTFIQLNGRPAQSIAPFAMQSLPVVDLQGLAEDARQRQAERLLGAAARCSFDLERGPLLHTVVLRLAAQRRLLALTLHHIVSDGWSLGVLFEELRVSYGAWVAGRVPDLPALPIQTADFAIWQRQWLRGEALERQISYWKACLEGAPEAMEWPTDRPRPAQPSYRGRALPMRLERELSRALNELSQRHGVTLFMSLLAGFFALLGRHLGRQDLVVGSPISNRHHVETEGLIGFFVNSLVLRVDLAGNPSAVALLARVSQVTLGAYDHQDLPFETLVSVLQPRRDLSRHPLFQIFFQVLNAPLAEVRVEGVELRRVKVATRTSKFDFNLVLGEGKGGLVGELGYSLDLYDATTMERLIRNYRTLLAGMVAAPQRPLVTLPLLDRAELHQVLLEWAPTPARLDNGAPLSGCLQGRVVGRAAEIPEAIALLADGQWLSYGCLVTQAKALAGVLRAQGVGPEVPVGICLERTAALPVAILGVLMAGATYVPMDPSYPAERLQWMLEDSGARRVLTSAALRRTLPLAEGVALELDGRRAAVPTLHGVEEPRMTTAENLALVIYTSGSTGRPKGVAITQGGVLTLLDWAAQTYGGEELRGVFAATSINFDLSVFELFVPWNQGGTVILGRDALALGELPAGQRVTLINTVPSAFGELLRRRQVPAQVRVVNLAGEPLPAELVRQAAAHPGIERVFNLYGPSEDTTYSTVARVDQQEAVMPPIGRPLAGKEAFLLDRRGRPVGPGMSGELHLGGSGLARCYWRRPAATAERFVPHPFPAAGTVGERLYRSGDVARFLADGQLHFLGRFDDQVKVRGYRIELGEIERHLARHPLVGEARVLARGDLGRRRLIAWLVPTTPTETAAETSTETSTETVERPPTADRLRRFLLEYLPGYMVPSDFVVLEDFPRLPNGKLDRRLLKDPAAERPALEVAYQAPVGEVETVISEVLGEVLGIEQAGREDNFFDLGGHSLLMVEVQTRLSERLGRPLPVLELFRHPTVRSLAEHLAGGDPKAPSFAERSDRQQPLDAARQRRSQLRQARRRGRR